MSGAYHLPPTMSGCGDWADDDAAMSDRTTSAGDNESQHDDDEYVPADSDERFDDSIDDDFISKLTVFKVRTCPTCAHSQGLSNYVSIF